MAPTEEMNLVDFDRSNKGASKQRRDQINAEIATMRDLLPLAESARQRLSQLQIMSLTCVYIRKCNVLQKLFRSKCPDARLPQTLDFFQALTGFLLVTTREGKLLYISENVTDFLGHSMVDMKTQGDSLYDIVDKRDQRAVQSQLLQAGSAPDSKEPNNIAFFCRMNMSRTLKRQSGFGDVKVMHVRGHFVQVSNNEPGCPGESQSVFMATCSPLITPDLKENLIQNNTLVFKSVHRLDMTFMEVTKTGEYHLDQTTEELNNTSWYSLLHPEDIHEAKEKHVQLIRSNHEMGCMMTVRMLKPDGSHFWVNIVMHVRQASLAQNEEPLIVCINQVIQSHEAYQIKMQGHMFSMYPGRAHELWGAHVPAAAPQEMPAPWTHQNGAHPIQMSSFPSPVPSFISQGHPPMYHFQCPPGMAMARNGKPMVGIPAFNPANIVQSDKLKAMLKRKIQGPQPGSCRPTKLAKMTWDMKGNGGGQGYTEMEQSMPMMEQFSHMSMPMCADSQGHSVQVMQPSNYRLGVMTARKSADVINCHGIAMPALTKSEIMVAEQVVPDVNVPDSFLTPDPSPVSSPQPSKIIVKTEVMDPEETSDTVQAKSSVSILKALEKLATLPQAQSTESKPVALPRHEVRRRRELPIFDAFDIDNFFANLEKPEDDAKVSIKVESTSPACLVKKEIKEDAQCTRSNIPNFGALGQDKCPSPCQEVHSPFQADSPVVAQSPIQQASLPVEPLPETHPEAAPSSPANRSSSPSTKDLVVSSLMVSSPKSLGSPERFDDLLSCFSDDGLDLSPLQMDPRSTILETSVNEDLLDDHLEKNYSGSFYKDLRCGTDSVSSATPEEFSPHPSNASPLAGEEELAEDASTFTLAMALDALHAQEEVCPSSIKARDVLGLADELNLFVGAF